MLGLSSVGPVKGEDKRPAVGRKPVETGGRRWKVVRAGPVIEVDVRTDLAGYRAVRGVAAVIPGLSRGALLWARSWRRWGPPSSQAPA